VTGLRRRRLSSAGPEVGALGLGCMGMSWGYRESMRDDAAAERVVSAALDAGVNLLDTAAVYGDGHNERLVGSVAGRRRDEAVIATKVGLVVDDLATRRMHRDGRPDTIRRAVQDSLARLGVDHIDLLYLHRVDPDVPLTDTWAALAEQVRLGNVGMLGLSEVSCSQAEQAHAVHPVAAIQSELSLWTRDPLGAAGSGRGSGEQDEPAGTDPGDVVAWCAAHGAAFVPFAPLGRGFLTGTLDDSFEPSDFRASNPRFSAAHRAANERILRTVRAVAERMAVQPAQVALAWVLQQGEHVVPIPGTTSVGHLLDNIAAAGLVLDAEALAALDAVPAAAGSRY